MIAHLLEQANESLKLEDGAIVSMNPPETLFGFTYHAHMIPPKAPAYALDLGHGGGTVAKLILKIWPSTNFRLIDSHLGEDSEDALEFLFSDRPHKYDYICVDLWNGSKVCEFIYVLGVAQRLHEICTGLLCMNIPAGDSEDKALVYHEAGFKYLRHDVVESNAVIWWKA